MKQLLILSIATTFILLSSCEDSVTENQTSNQLDLDFYAVYDDQPLVMLDFYDYSNQDSINFGTSDFYFSDCYLTDESGNILELVDVALIDFTNQNKDQNSAQTPITLTISDIPNGEYTSLTFSIGINEERNATMPEDYTPDNPLSLSGHYWPNWDSYIFAKFQGKLTNQNSEDVDWLFHTGKNEVFRTFTYPIELFIDNQKSNISLTLDHQAIFNLGGGDYMDIRSKPTNHDPNDIEPFIQITENMEAAISLRVD